MHVWSENDFPTAAGLASSAAGYAALTASLGRLFNVSGDLSAVARRGSGSACRSMFGGFVEWTKGEDDTNGKDSVAKQTFPESHWHELRVFILVISGRKKATGSTDGMQRSVETSSLLRHRADIVVPKRIAEVKRAIESRDFHAFAQLCMEESNQLHAICRDTYPPLHYLNDTSLSVIDFVHAFNCAHLSNRLAYTFDAGPNAFLFTLESFVSEVAQNLYHYFGPNNDDVNFIRNLEVDYHPSQCTSLPIKRSLSQVEYVIYTKAGPGPLVVESDL